MGRGEVIGRWPVMGRTCCTLDEICVLGSNIVIAWRFLLFLVVILVRNEYLCVCIWGRGRGKEGCMGREGRRWRYWQLDQPPHNKATSSSNAIKLIQQQLCKLDLFLYSSVTCIILWMCIWYCNSSTCMWPSISRVVCQESRTLISLRQDARAKSGQGKVYFLWPVPILLPTWHDCRIAAGLEACP